MTQLASALINCVSTSMALQAHVAPRGAKSDAQKQIVDVEGLTRRGGQHPFLRASLRLQGQEQRRQPPASTQRLAVRLAAMSLVEAQGWRRRALSPQDGLLWRHGESIGRKRLPSLTYINDLPPGRVCRTSTVGSNLRWSP